MAPAEPCRAMYILIISIYLNKSMFIYMIIYLSIYIYIYACMDDILLTCTHPSSSYICAMRWDMSCMYICMLCCVVLHTYISYICMLCMYVCDRYSIYLWKKATLCFVCFVQWRLYYPTYGTCIVSEDQICMYVCMCVCMYTVCMYVCLFMSVYATRWVTHFS